MADRVSGGSIVRGYTALPGMPLVQQVARAICIADGCDPDAIGYGHGERMPKDQRYPLWCARVEQARAAIAAMQADAPR